MFLLVVIAAAAAGAQQEANADDKSKIIALERVAKIQACEHKDLRTLDAILDDDFFHVDTDGKVQNKAEVLVAVQTSEPLHYLMEAMVVQMHNDTAIVTGLYQIKGISHGVPFLATRRFVDTWLLKNGRWVIIASLATPAE